MHPHLIARFRADSAALWPAGDRLAVAVSGGPDSLALLLLAHAARPGEVEAATVDHGLRAESASEAAMVAALCADLGVAHETLPVTVASGNMQAQARQARYAALGEWMKHRQLGLLATAHHADDQAETLLMRLNRGSGVDGMAGVRATGHVPGHDDLRLIRPLLGWRKAELAGMVADAGIDAVQDPSNQDAAYDRARLRHALAGADWLDPMAMAQSAANLADAAEALEWQAQREWDDCIAPDEDGLIYTPQAPRAIRLKVLARAVAQLGGPARGSAIASLHDALERGEGGNVAGVLVKPVAQGWSLRREPPRN